MRRALNPLEGRIEFSEVILRLRSLLKKAPFEIKDIDFNEVVRETVDLLSGLAVTRQVELRNALSTVPLPVKGTPFNYSR